MSARSVLDRPAPVLAAYTVVSGGIAMAAAVFVGWVLHHFLDGLVVTAVQLAVWASVAVALGWYADVLDDWIKRRRRP